MTAKDMIRNMLDQLMGTERNGDPASIKFSDKQVCKSFLLGCCPHDILASTRMNLGECPRLHHMAFRADYERAQNKQDYYFDIEALEYLTAFIADCDERTRSAKERLREEFTKLPSDTIAIEKQLKEVCNQIEEDLRTVEVLGSSGQVDESMQLMQKVLELQEKRDRLQLEFRSAVPSNLIQQHKLRVCDVCSAYLGHTEKDERLADHFGGKLHLGFLEIRRKLEELQKTAGPRKLELKRKGLFNKVMRECNRVPSCHARELSRRAARHREPRELDNRHRSNSDSNKENNKDKSRKDGSTESDTTRERSSSMKKESYESRENSSERMRSRDSYKRSQSNYNRYNERQQYNSQRHNRNNSRNGHIRYSNYRNNNNNSYSNGYKRYNNNYRRSSNNFKDRKYDQDHSNDRNYNRDCERSYEGKRSTNNDYSDDDKYSHGSKNSRVQKDNTVRNDCRESTHYRKRNKSQSRERTYRSKGSPNEEKYSHRLKYSHDNKDNHERKGSRDHYRKRSKSRDRQQSYKYADSGKDYKVYDDSPKRKRSYNGKDHQDNGSPKAKYNKRDDDRSYGKRNDDKYSRK